MELPYGGYYYVIPYMITIYMIGVHCMKKTWGTILLASIVCIINILLLIYIGILADELQIIVHASQTLITLLNIILYIFVIIRFLTRAHTKNNI